MKKVRGYLIDPTTGSGIAGEPVTYKDLSGTNISTGTHGTVYQTTDATTQADGSFTGKFELSPGPIQLLVDVSASEKRTRKWNEMAQMESVWSSDILGLGRSLGDGVLKGYLSDLALSIVSGHTFRIAKGGAVVNAHWWALEDLGGAAGYDILGTTNPGGSGINPRLDLVSLRQYNFDAAGQLAGKQDVVVTLGSTSNVIPAIPTGADFKVLPIGVLSTAEGGATKTIYTTHPYPQYIGQGSRATIFAKNVTDSLTTITTSYGIALSITVPNLNPALIYDGEVHIFSEYESTFDAAGALEVQANLDNTFIGGGAITDHTIWQDGPPDQPWTFPRQGSMTFTWPLIGVTGVSTLTFDWKLRRNLSSDTFIIEDPWVDYPKAAVMEEVSSAIGLIERITQLSGTGALIGILYLFYSRKVVWGWQLDDIKKKCDVYESLLRDNTTKIEARLAEYEQRERSRHGTS